MQTLNLPSLTLETCNTFSPTSQTRIHLPSRCHHTATTPPRAPTCDGLEEPVAHGRLLVGGEGDFLRQTPEVLHRLRRDVVEVDQVAAAVKNTEEQRRARNDLVELFTDGEKMDLHVKSPVLAKPTT